MFLIREVEVWAKNPQTGICCHYGTLCNSSAGWLKYYLQDECEKESGECKKDGETISSSGYELCCGFSTVIKSYKDGNYVADNLVCANCGDGVCGAGENKYNCVYDCGEPVCGDGICSKDEDGWKCPQDCPRIIFGSGYGYGYNASACRDNSDCGVCQSCKADSHLNPIFFPKIFQNFDTMI